MKIKSLLQISCGKKKNNDINTLYRRVMLSDHFKDSKKSEGMFVG